MERRIRKEFLFYGDLKFFDENNSDYNISEKDVLLLRTSLSVYGNEYINLEKCKNIIDIIKSKTISSSRVTTGKIFVDEETISPVYPLDEFGKVDIKTVNSLKKRNKR